MGDVRHVLIPSFSGLRLVRSESPICDYQRRLNPFFFRSSVGLARGVEMGDDEAS